MNPGYIIGAFALGIVITWFIMNMRNRRDKKELDDALCRVLEYQTQIKRHGGASDDAVLIDYVPHMKKIIDQMAMHDETNEQEVIKKAVALLYTVKESKIKHGSELVICVNNRPIQRLSGY